MTEFVHVKGFSQLDSVLQTFPAKVERNMLRGALRAGANVVLPVARGNIHSVSGELARSLKVRSDARGGKVTAKVYTRVFYGRFVEWGTKPHRIEPLNRKSLSFGGAFLEWVQHPGSRGFGFMRHALDTQAAAAVLAAGEYLKRRLATKHGIDTADIELGETQ